MIQKWVRKQQLWVIFYFYSLLSLSLNFKGEHIRSQNGTSFAANFFEKQLQFYSKNNKSNQRRPSASNLTVSIHNETRVALRRVKWFIDGGKMASIPPECIEQGAKREFVITPPSFVFSSLNGSVHIRKSLHSFFSYPLQIVWCAQFEGKVFMREEFLLSFTQSVHHGISFKVPLHFLSFLFFHLRSFRWFHPPIFL